MGVSHKQVSSTIPEDTWQTYISYGHQQPALPLRQSMTFTQDFFRKGSSRRSGRRGGLRQTQSGRAQQTVQGMEGFLVSAWFTAHTRGLHPTLIKNTCPLNGNQIEIHRARTEQTGCAVRLLSSKTFSFLTWSRSLARTRLSACLSLGLSVRPSVSLSVLSG